MGKYKNMSEFLTACMDAVRAKKGTSAKIIGENLPDEITSIPTGGRDPVIQALTATENKTYATPSGVDGFNPVNVQVPIPKGLTYFDTMVDLPGTETGDCYFLKNNDFIKAHKDDPNLFAFVFAENPDVGVDYISFIAGFNRAIAKAPSGSLRYSVVARIMNTSDVYGLIGTGKLDGNPYGYQGQLVIWQGKDLLCTVAPKAKIKAGRYRIFMCILPAAQLE